VGVAASIVVPTFRRNDLLRRCLETLAAQDFELSRYEILIADDAGDESTAELVEQFSHHAACPVRYVRVGPAHGPAAARNAGWRAASGRIIAFTDDDCLPAASWLREGVAVLEGAGAAAATGQVVVPLPDQPTDYERDCAGLSRGEFVTANCFCRRDALEAVGGFDDRFKAAWREDSDLQFTLLEHGYRIVQAPAAVVIHPVRPARWGVSLKQQKKTAFNALLYRKHRELYQSRIEPTPRGYYAIAASLLGVAAGVAASSWPLAAIFAAAWTILTAHFCRRRLRGTSLRPQHVAEMAVTSAIIPPLSLYWHCRGMLAHRVWFQ
jgi:glycosyltransferase involved in cell wall biosynthesis